MSAFFGLDANYEQSNFNEISAEDLVLISGGDGWECAAGVAGYGLAAGGAALAAGGWTNPVGWIGTAIATVGGGFMGASEHCFA